ncbi:hypothetical protein [Sulfurimonas sp.]|uniref:hypothetical protein n=1 Tax=Sulfurimonas sp. TaxID=2022749 RepID=UPI00260AA5DE|nr:hypothetical protein [Sulfurimonas sp.]
MGTISKYKILSQAKESFSKAEYKRALDRFAEVLRNFPNSKEAYNGVILSEMAMSGEEGAEALFDYYEVLIKENKEEADVIMAEILDSIDGTLEKIGKIFSDPLRDRLEYEDGILYADFQQLLDEGADFKETFENIMFSTRVIITKKEDFLDFLDKLIENGFAEMALSYLEKALSVYPSDKLLTKLLQNLQKVK